MTDRKMRRWRQALTENESIEILKRGKVAVMAVAGDDKYPYAVPLNYVYFDGCVYVHSASQGHKIDALKRNPKCSFCVVDRDDILPEEFTSYFRSIIAFGKAEFIETEEEKIRALQALCEKYSPGLNPINEINKCLNSVLIIRVRLEHVMGKEAIELIRQ